MKRLGKPYAGILLLAIPAEIWPSLWQVRIQREDISIITTPWIGTGQPAKTKDVAVAILGRRTIDRILPQDDYPVSEKQTGQKRDHTMPGILHNPPTQLIRQVRLGQPLPKPYIVIPRPFEDLPPRCPELGAARHSNFLGNLRAREQLHKPLLEVLARMNVVAVGRRVRADLDRTAQDPSAAEIYITAVLEVGDLDAPYHWHAVVVGVVVVPLVALGVDEEDSLGEVVIMVNYIPVESRQSSDTGSQYKRGLLTSNMSWTPGPCSMAPSTRHCGRRQRRYTCASRENG